MVRASQWRWILNTYICISYSLAYLKYLNKYALTANVSAYVKYVNTFACRNYLRKIVPACQKPRSAVWSPAMAHI